MICPDINRLIDSLSGEGPDIELGVHLEECASCRVDFRLLGEIPGAFRPDIVVPERLIQRVLEDPSFLKLPETHYQVSAFQVFGSGLLGSLTAIGAMVATGSVGSGTPAVTLLLSVAVGVAACVGRIRWGKEPSLAEA